MRRRVPYSLSAIALVLFVATIWFAVTGRGGCTEQWTPVGSAAAAECDAMRATNDVAEPWEKVAITGLGTAFVLLGSFLLRRVEGNNFGLVFCIEGMLFLATGFAGAYTVHGLVESSLPAGSAIAVLSEIVGGPIVFVPFAFFFLLYPTGSVPGPRWWIVAWGAVLSGVVLLVTTTFGAERLRLARLHDHPVEIEAISAIREPVEIVALLVFLVSMIGAIASLIMRFRRARGVERQQIKWFATAAAFVAVVVACGPIFWSTPTLEPLWGPVFVTALASLPAAATLSVLRYRLYDIDVVINRALVYVILTGLLLGCYLVIVVTLSRVMGPVTRDSDIAVAASTLAVAALFRPLRARIQGFIDRRFYRAKYDAAAALDRFGARLRDEVDIDLVRSDVLGVVADTMQPRHASLWLRHEGAQAL